MRADCEFSTKLEKQENEEPSKQIFSIRVKLRNPFPGPFINEKKTFIFPLILSLLSPFVFLFSFFHTYFFNCNHNLQPRAVLEKRRSWKKKKRTDKSISLYLLSPLTPSPCKIPPLFFSKSPTQAKPTCPCKPCQQKLKLKGRVIKE